MLLLDIGMLDIGKLFCLQLTYRDTFNFIPQRILMSFSIF